MWFSGFLVVCCLVVWLFLVALLSGVIAFGVAQFYDLSVALCPALLLCISCVIFFIWDLRIIYTMGNVAGRDRICNCPQWSFVGPAKNMVATETVSRVYTRVQGMVTRRQNSRMPKGDTKNLLRIVCQNSSSRLSTPLSSIQ